MNIGDLKTKNLEYISHNFEKSKGRTQKSAKINQEVLQTRN